jgi:hypothetical protein
VRGDGAAELTADCVAVHPATKNRITMASATRQHLERGWFARKLALMRTLESRLFLMAVTITVKR